MCQGKTRNSRGKEERCGKSALQMMKWEKTSSVPSERKKERELANTLTHFIPRSCVWILWRENGKRERKREMRTGDTAGGHRLRSAPRERPVAERNHNHILYNVHHL